MDSPGLLEISHDSCPAISEILDVVERKRMVSVSRETLRLADDVRRRYEELVERGEKVYGYCTGLGQLYTRNPGRCGPAWEKHVLEEHAMGVGEYAALDIVRAFLTVRLIQLSRARAPVRGVVIERLVDALNNDITPLVHLHGSVGASGDLAPSAEAFLCLYYGEGTAYSNGSVSSCREALKKHGLEPLELEGGEALALINNTAWSTGILILSTRSLRELWFTALDSFAQSARVAGCNHQHYNADVLGSSAHEGVRKVGSLIRALAGECSGRRLQDPYSLRCTPQVMGAVHDILEFAERIAVEEACSSTENPVVIDGGLYHWCGFHSIYAGIAADLLRLGIAHLANLVERRIAQLLRSEITGLPDFLAREDDSVGAMILQYTSASLASRIRWLANPVTVHNIPTSGLQEDVVPQSPEAGYSLAESLVHLAHLISLEKALASYASTGMEGGVKELRSKIDEYVGEVARRASLEWAIYSRLVR
ncbi:MAG: aromatic amino acid ammonia-lyase [Desulfurococcales archaeon]|nr:aromatic amino acid ammonia-lyase [Desulfurococcales archaeon]